MRGMNLAEQYNKMIAMQARPPQDPIAALGWSKHPVGTIEFVVGRLLCPTVRNVLSEAKFNGHDISWFESEGWLQRKFVVKGQESVLKQIVKWLSQFKEPLA
jgi:hypothetical protein